MSLFLAAHWRAVGALIIAAVLFSYIETLRVERDLAYKGEAKAKADLLLFKTEVAELGKKAEAERIAKEAADKKRKDDADAQNASALATLDGLLKRARSRPVSSPAACPASPDGAARFRAESERAYRDLVEGLRAEGERSSKAVIGLNTAKGWAHNRGTPP